MNTVFSMPCEWRAACIHKAGTPLVMQMPRSMTIRTGAEDEYSIKLGHAAESVPGKRADD